ncbi:unnamed protein product [Adineta steineri]|uniref:Uncharacterized protein n=1 Tax=Adineta steineri TaxID=433720 RepID=A0A814R7A7_9BILA|nr:unnamed protein product [Adineta steineri]CAF1130128.1 unnamed protein product [Adineta steineri]CAF3686795.1 unnamed protein product [Adineta steineri]CAF3696948.1 unnamed protein product [Adineta steineri]CAF3772680.1 unnamed protein product [Adineta steineri]
MTVSCWEEVHFVGIKAAVINAVDHQPKKQTSTSYIPMAKQIIISILIVLLCMMHMNCQNINGTVSCRHSGHAHSCPADTCIAIGVVLRERTYPSDCYVIGEPTTRGEFTSAIWYHLYLPTGKEGFASDLVCAGPMGRCRRIPII